MAAAYSKETVEEGKSLCKEKFMEDLDLTDTPSQSVTARSSLNYCN